MGDKDRKPGEHRQHQIQTGGTKEGFLEEAIVT